MCLNCTPPKITKGPITGTLTKWTFGMDLFKAWFVQNMVGTSFGWPCSKAKNEKVSIPIPTQSLIHGFFRFL
jgi:hypothetical protein